MSCMSCVSLSSRWLQSAEFPVGQAAKSDGRYVSLAMDGYDQLLKSLS